MSVDVHIVLFVEIVLKTIGIFKTDVKLNGKTEYTNMRIACVLTVEDSTNVASLNRKTLILFTLTYIM